MSRFFALLLCSLVAIPGCGGDNAAGPTPVPTRVLLSPTPLLLSSDGTGSLDVVIDGASNMVSARFVISFDPAALEVTEVVIDSLSNHILRSGGATLVVSDNQYDNDAGRIVVGALGRLEEFRGVTGSGPFATIRLKARRTLSSPVTLSFTAFEVYNYPVGNPATPSSRVSVAGGTVQSSAP